MAMDTLNTDIVIFIITTTLCIVCGAVGNGLVIAVFVSKKRRFPKRTYILTLAVVDLVVMTLVAPYSIVYELRLVVDHFVCHAFEIIRYTLIGYSNLILILIASERLLLVWKPLKIMSSRTKYACIIGFLIFSIICASPAAAIKNVSLHIAQPSNNSTQSSPEYCSLTTSILGENGIDVYLKFIAFLVYLTILILIITYVFIYVRIYQQRKKLESVFVGSTRAHNNSVKSNRSVKERIQDVDHEAIQDCQPTGKQVMQNGEINLVGDTTRHSKDGPNLDQASELAYIHLDDCAPNTYDARSKCSEELKSNIIYSPSQESRRKRVCSTVSVNISTSGKSHPKKCSSAGKRLSTAQKRSNVDTKTWTMLSVCTFIYIICWIPFSMNILGVFKSLVSKYFFFIGQATNPIIYSIVNVKVRKEIKELFFGKSFQERNRRNHTTSSFVLSSVNSSL